MTSSESGSASNEDDGIQIIDAGAEAIGSLGGAGLGLVIAGPPGALIGAVAAPIGTAIIKQAARVARAHLSKREEVRVGSVLATAASEISRRTKDGENLRSDGFFELSVDNRSAGDEVVEAVVRAAESEAEERKLPYIGFLLANIAFDETVSREFANRFVSLAHGLTYLEISYLALFHVARQRIDELDLADELPAEAKTYALSGASEMIARLDPIWSIYTQHFISGPSRSMGIGGLVPNELQSFGVGKQLAELMELNRMPIEELKKLAREIPRAGRD